MTNYTRRPTRRPRRNPFIWNALTLLVLISTICLAWYFVSIFIEPHSALNPFPPRSLPTLHQTETPTATIIQLGATWTPSLTIPPSPTRTRAPSWTPLPGMVTPTVTDESEETTPMPATAEIDFQASTTVRPDSACNWLGVGGKVLDAEGGPLKLQTVQLGGALGTQFVSRMSLSGNAPAYGESGFEFVLGDQPVASTQTLWIQLFDNGGAVLTEKIYFDTHAECDQNLVMITFTMLP